MSLACSPRQGLSVLLANIGAESGLGRGLVRKSLVLCAQEPEFHPQNPHKKTKCGVGTCHPSAGDTETGGYLGLGGPSQLNYISELQASERTLSQKGGGE